jgi:hypothetical protein
LGHIGELAEHLNGILAPLRIMDSTLKVLKLNFRLGNADFDRGTLRKY